ncbi:MAG: response regulator transcription factor [Deltaproteobacteria bacterium]|nr:response regulator transcription factor [Deltaproteobacteria bacterium]
MLLVDDDPSLNDVLALALGDAGYEVATAEDGSEALERLARPPLPELIVSDINMPVLDGFTLLKRLRERGSSIPVILLTSRDGEIDETLGFELGADDYVAKPFSTRVLLARIAAILRRDQVRASGAEPDPAITCGELELRVDHMLARYRDVLLETTVTEFRMLEAFARRPGAVLSRDRLMELGRGDDSIVGERIVDTYVRRLRRKLEAIDPGFDRIETVVGAGYRWKV